MKTKLILSQILFLPIIGFLFYMGILSNERAGKNYDDLTFASGKLIEYRMFEHIKPVNRYGIRHKLKIIAFKLEGNGVEFGVTENDPIYSKLKKHIKTKKRINAELYYDQNGQRIEGNVSLHIFEIKLDGKSLSSIEKVKNLEKKGTIIFFTLGLLFLLIDIWGVKMLRKSYTQNKI